MRHFVFKVSFVAFGLLIGRGGLALPPSGMTLIPAGTYRPFFLEKKSTESGGLLAASTQKKIEIRAFWLDTFPVTIESYLLFLKKNPTWRKSQIKSIFADSHYLKSWSNDLQSRKLGQSPITEISWFAANAYCHWLGKELPTLAQWEYAAFDKGRNLVANQKKILEWYSRPNTQKIGPVGQGLKNGFGLYDLHGLIWEWVSDFNSAAVSPEDQEAASNLYCGAGASSSRDPADYASFMRFSLRNSLKASYTTANLGFRCAKEFKK